jgi:hypothetical protein
MPQMLTFAVIGVVLLLGGCASGASTQGMTVTPADVPVHTIPTELQDTMAIGLVTGGESTNPMWTSEVGNEEFKEALRNSLRVERIYNGNDDSRYVLDAHLIDVNQPLIGFDTEVTSTVRYVVTERSSSETVFEEMVVAEYTATMGESWYGVERLKLANEGSIRSNIAEFIKRLVQRFG